jgi:DNA-binding NtrC family response regulator
MPEKVLIVEDEENARTGLAELVSAWGYRTETAKDGLDALDKVIAWSPMIVITDLKMPRMDGLELLERLADQPNQIAVVMLTAQGSIDSAVDAMKMGAYDYIQKPVDPTRLRAILQNAARQQGTERELEVTRRQLRDAGILGRLVGKSKKMQEIFALTERVADHWRERDGQRDACANFARLESAQRKAVRRDQLFSNPGNAYRERDFWSREGRIYWCSGA